MQTIAQLHSVVRRVSDEGVCTCELDIGQTLQVRAVDLVVLSKSTVQLNRIDTVKQLFHAYANRSMAYNLPHVVGLTLFGSEVQVACPLTEAYESFKGIAIAQLLAQMHTEYTHTSKHICPNCSARTQIHSNASTRDPHCRTSR